MRKRSQCLTIIGVDTSSAFPALFCFSFSSHFIILLLFLNLKPLVHHCGCTDSAPAEGTCGASPTTQTKAACPVPVAAASSSSVLVQHLQELALGPSHSQGQTDGWDPCLLHSLSLPLCFPTFPSPFPVHFLSIPCPFRLYFLSIPSPFRLHSLSISSPFRLCFLSIPCPFPVHSLSILALFPHISLSIPSPFPRSTPGAVVPAEAVPGHSALSCQHLQLLPVPLQSKNQPHRRGEYNVYSTFQSHEPEFDYLKSLEIEEKINKIRWLPQQNAAYFLLSTNGAWPGSLGSLHQAGPCLWCSFGEILVKNPPCRCPGGMDLAKLNPCAPGVSHGSRSV